MIEGRLGRGASAPEAILAVEISVNIERHDVTRAVERAAVLGKVGYRAVPVVAGAFIAPGAHEFGLDRGVQFVLNPDDLAPLETLSGRDEPSVELSRS